MKRNSKLSLALHALGHMATQPKDRLQSDVIAKFNGTNPVVVRRVLGRLREVGLVGSEKGHAGGWLLLRPADQISVADVYVALADPQFPPPEVEDSHCPIERMLFDVFEDAMSEAERTLIEQLRGVTIADLSRSMNNHPDL